MKEIPDGWEVVSRQGDYGSLLRILSAFFTLVPPGPPDTITIRVREKSTGLEYSITAIDEREALLKLQNRIFDQ
jgi:hypothetical protein